MFNFKLFGNRKTEVRANKKCFFEKDRVCDRTCRAFTENNTCSIVDRLKEKADTGECARLLKTLCQIDCDPKRVAEEFPELVPPPKLVYED